VLRHTLRASRIAVGVVLLVAGLLLSLPLVPGPGVLLIVGGLTVLSGEFEWARRLRGRLRDAFHRVRDRHPWKRHAG
jgi:uncharacterized membrane protein HdeD (DUF308 family)